MQNGVYRYIPHLQWTERFFGVLAICLNTWVAQAPGTCRKIRGEPEKAETKDGPGKGKSHHLRTIKKATHLLQIMCFLNLRCGHMLRVQLILDKCADSQRCYGYLWFTCTVPIIVISSIGRSIKNSLALWNSTFPRLPSQACPGCSSILCFQNESVRLSSRRVSFSPLTLPFWKDQKGSIGWNH